MEAFFAIMACVIIQIGALIMLDDLSHRRYREVAYFIFIVVLAGVMFYVGMSKSPDFQHTPWYQILAWPVGTFIFTIYTAFCILNSNHKGK